MENKTLELAKELLYQLTGERVEEIQCTDLDIVLTYMNKAIDYAHSSTQLKDKEEELNRIKRIEWLKGVTEYTIWADYVPNGNSICDKFEDELKELLNL